MSRSPWALSASACSWTSSYSPDTVTSSCSVSAAIQMAWLDAQTGCLASDVPPRPRSHAVRPAPSLLAEEELTDLRLHD